MNLGLLKIAAIPARLIDLSPGYSRPNLRNNSYGHSREGVGQWGVNHHRLNVGEGRAYDNAPKPAPELRVS